MTTRFLSRLRVRFSLAACCAIGFAMLTGCAADFSDSAQSSAPGTHLGGVVMGGDQPVTNSKIYMYAVGTGGYNQPSRSMLGGSGYVTSTGTDGHWSITSDYTCQTGDLVYIVASGGNPGLANANANNPDIGLMVALGACSALTPNTRVIINEETTVAAAYALSGFMSSATSVSCGCTSQALTGITNAFATAANLVSPQQGSAYATTVNGAGTLPQAEFNSLADILAACVNSDGTTTACSSLMSAATPASGTKPADTLQAAINIARNPGRNVAALWSLATTYNPFQPTLSAQPHDWSLALTYTGGGISNPNLLVDASGSIWTFDGSSAQGSVTELSPLGAPRSPSTGYTTGALSGMQVSGIVLDANSHLWVTTEDPNTYTYYLVELTSGGTQLNSSPGYTNPNLNWSNTFDNSGRLWSCNTQQGFTGSAYTFSNTYMPFQTTSGTFGSTYFGGTGGICFVTVTDASNNVWTTNVLYDISGTETGNLNKFAVASNSLVTPTGGVSSAPLLASQTIGTDIAFDHTGNVWIPSLNSPLLSEFNSSASLLSGAGYDSGLGAGLYSAQVDGNGHLWVTSASALAEMTTTGTAGTILSPAGGYQASSLYDGDSFRIDQAGNLWLSNFPSCPGCTDSNVTEFVGLAAPSVEPYAVASSTNTYGVLP